MTRDEAVRIGVKALAAWHDQDHGNHCVCEGSNQIDRQAATVVDALVDQGAFAKDGLTSYVEGGLDAVAFRLAGAWLLISASDTPVREASQMFAGTTWAHTVALMLRGFIEAAGRPTGWPWDNPRFSQLAGVEPRRFPGSSAWQRPEADEHPGP